jgi:3D (Asp-Asp-Asp) domain-containing protein
MEALKLNHKRKINPKLAKKLIFSLVFVLVFEFFLFPIPSLANEPTETTNITGKIVEINNKMIAAASENVFAGRLPENQNLEVISTTKRIVSAYNSEVAQCDDSPCITANGFNVCEHGIEDTVAANFLKLGTKIRIPEAFGDKVFVVRDRMNKRYSNRIDIWMVKKEDAKLFGVQALKIEILE